MFAAALLEAGEQQISSQKQHSHKKGGGGAGAGPGTGTGTGTIQAQTILESFFTTLSSVQHHPPPLPSTITLPSPSASTIQASPSIDTPPRRRKERVDKHRHRHRHTLATSDDEASDNSKDGSRSDGDSDSIQSTKQKRRNIKKRVVVKIDDDDDDDEEESADNDGPEAVGSSPMKTDEGWTCELCGKVYLALPALQQHYVQHELQKMQKSEQQHNSNSTSPHPQLSSSSPSSSQTGNLTRTLFTPDRTPPSPDQSSTPSSASRIVLPAHLAITQLPLPPIPSAGGSADDDDVVCGICLSGESPDENQIILCDGPCQMAYHQDCISMEYIPEGDWYCSKECESGEGVDVVKFVTSKREEYEERQRVRIQASKHRARSDDPNVIAIQNFYHSLDGYFDLAELVQRRHVLAQTSISSSLLQTVERERWYGDVWEEEDLMDDMIADDESEARSLPGKRGAAQQRRRRIGTTHRYSRPEDEDKKEDEEEEDDIMEIDTEEVKVEIESSSSSVNDPTMLAEKKKKSRLLNALSYETASDRKKMEMRGKRKKKKQPSLRLSFYAYLTAQHPEVTLPEETSAPNLLVSEVDSLDVRQKSEQLEESHSDARRDQQSKESAFISPSRSSSVSVSVLSPNALPSLHSHQPQSDSPFVVPSPKPRPSGKQPRPGMGNNNNTATSTTNTALLSPVHHPTAALSPCRPHVQLLPSPSANHAVQSNKAPRGLTGNHLSYSVSSLSLSSPAASLSSSQSSSRSLNYEAERKVSGMKAPRSSGHAATHTPLSNGDPEHKQDDDHSNPSLSPPLGKSLPVGKTQNSRPSTATTEQPMSTKAPSTAPAATMSAVQEMKDAIEAPPPPFFSLRSFEVEYFRQLGFRATAAVNNSLSASSHYIFPPYVYDVHTQTIESRREKKDASVDGQDESANQKQKQREEQEAAEQRERDKRQLLSQQRGIDMEIDRIAPHGPPAHHGQPVRVPPALLPSLPAASSSSALTSSSSSSSSSSSLSSTPSSSSSLSTSSSPVSTGRGSALTVKKVRDPHLNTWVIKADPNSQTTTAVAPAASSPPAFLSSAPLIESLSPADTDEITSELWLVQHEYLAQILQNNLIRARLEQQAQHFLHKYLTRHHLPVSLASLSPSRISSFLQHLRTARRTNRSWQDLYAESHLQSRAWRKYLAQVEEEEERLPDLTLTEADRDLAAEHRKLRRPERIVHRVVMELISSVDRNHRRRLARDRDSQRSYRRQQRTAHAKQKRDEAIQQKVKNCLEYIVRKIEKREEARKKRERLRGMTADEQRQNRAAARVRRKDKKHRRKMKEKEHQRKKKQRQARRSKERERQRRRRSDKLKRQRKKEVYYSDSSYSDESESASGSGSDSTSTSSSSDSSLSSSSGSRSSSSSSRSDSGSESSTSSSESSTDDDSDSSYSDDGSDSSASVEPLYCLCRTPYDDSQFYIACDNKGCPIGWYHGACVGITPADGENIDSYICAICEAKTGKHTKYIVDPEELQRESDRQAALPNIILQRIKGTGRSLSSRPLFTVLRNECASIADEEEYKQAVHLRLHHASSLKIRLHRQTLEGRTQTRKHSTYTVIRVIGKDVYWSQDNKHYAAELKQHPSTHILWKEAPGREIIYAEDGEWRDTPISTEKDENQAAGQTISVEAVSSRRSRTPVATSQEDLPQAQTRSSPVSLPLLKDEHEAASSAVRVLNGLLPSAEHADGATRKRKLYQEGEERTEAEAPSSRVRRRTRASLPLQQSTEETEEKHQQLTEPTKRTRRFRSRGDEGSPFPAAASLSPSTSPSPSNPSPSPSRLQSSSPLTRMASRSRAANNTEEETCTTSIKQNDNQRERKTSHRRTPSSTPPVHTRGTRAQTQTQTQTAQGGRSTQPSITDFFNTQNKEHTTAAAAAAVEEKQAEAGTMKRNRTTAALADDPEPKTPVTEDAAASPALSSSSPSPSRSLSLSASPIPRPKKLRRNAELALLDEVETPLHASRRPQNNSIHSIDNNTVE